MPAPVRFPPGQAEVLNNRGWSRLLRGDWRRRRRLFRAGRRRSIPSPSASRIISSLPARRLPATCPGGAPAKATATGRRDLNDAGVAAEAMGEHAARGCRLHPGARGERKLVCAGRQQSRSHGRSPVNLVASCSRLADRVARRRAGRGRDRGCDPAADFQCDLPRRPGRRDRRDGAPRLPARAVAESRRFPGLARPRHPGVRHRQGRRRGRQAARLPRPVGESQRRSVAGRVDLPRRRVDRAGLSRGRGCAPLAPPRRRHRRIGQTQIPYGLAIVAGAALVFAGQLGVMAPKHERPNPLDLRTPR